LQACGIYVLQHGRFFFTDIFIQVLALEGSGWAMTLGRKVFWTSAGIFGIMFILSGLNNARFRFIIAIAVPGKILVFLGTAIALLAGQAGVGIMFIGLGDLLFTIPFIMYLRATRQFGWI
jgi:hypothetical protein